MSVRSETTDLKRLSRLDVFPAFHKVADRRVVVVGHGGEAAAKVRLLGETNALIEVVSAEIEPELAEVIAAVGAHHIAEDFRPRHLNGAALVFSAREDERLDRAVVEAARILGVPANAVDKPELCDFYTGALVNRAPIAVAITSTGVGPVLARHIRARIEGLLPRSTGDLARLAESLRETAARVLTDGATRRRFWAKFFSGPVATNFYAGRPDVARVEAQRLLNAAQDESGFVWLVGAGPGAEDLLTLRAQRLLQEADVIVHDALVPDAVVAMGRRDAQRISVGKRKGAHSVPQDQINTVLVELAQEGHKVVRLKAGDPLVFGRAGEEMDALRAAGIGFEVVPGVTAAFAAAASAQIPLTLRGVASTLVFATGHNADSETLPDWAGLALKGATVAVYMGRTVAAAVSQRLIEAGLAATTPVAIIENAAHPEERQFAGTLADLPALGERTDISGATLIVIGEAVAQAALAKAEPIAARARAIIAA
ncbi:uroporphyrinogen-III C-methyltransferase [Microvirga tunisiensis]|uniref:Uroporphyrinogen-III C-methyltransferase n=2 Tax=Pannonibacter tanglangensis TaxID=2750084 RepID=A0ABW9ZLU4_9HYPH|nr:MULTISPECIES: siroheme synthase CysG [unclassified Pannonibacter]NBN64566.1 uroporphyrinogen-III C-methyltransferase [Pannonibacter sp. XCT-34]NBN79101.1 uroporphyrinogen-III C-methyltransferase [Pannonibacter sp. XCT-53]